MGQGSSKAEEEPRRRREAELAKFQASFGDGSFTVPQGEALSEVDITFGNTGKKPGKTSGVETQAELPTMFVAQLRVGDVHTNRALVGTIRKPRSQTCGIYFLLEDALGDLVRIGVYNAGFDAASAPAAFPAGQTLSIAAPFLDAGDGHAFVRVDDPDDIATPASTGPTDAAEWHEQGKP